MIWRRTCWTRRLPARVWGSSAHSFRAFGRFSSVWAAACRCAASGGNVAGMQLVAITDLTDLEFATRAVRRHQRQLVGLFGNSPAPMVIIDVDGVFRQCNSAFCQLVGYREEELVGRPCTEITHPDDVAEDRALIGELAQGKRVSFTLNKKFVTRRINGSAQVLRPGAIGRGRRRGGHRPDHDRHHGGYDNWLSLEWARERAARKGCNCEWRYRGGR